MNRHKNYREKNFGSNIRIILKEKTSSIYLASTLFTIDDDDDDDEKQKDDVKIDSLKNLSKLDEKGY